MNGPDIQMIAACGLECGPCPIRRASVGDRGAAESLVGWWRSMGWLEEGEGVQAVLARAPLCLGCHGDRDSHWAATCWILACAVDQRGQHTCAECAEFPCERLLQWSQENDNYAAALQRLRERRAG
jgi:hypothetical protein